MKSLFVILGNQLFDTKYIRDFKNSTFFMCEDYGLCTYQRHHKLKILLFLSSMRSYADLLKKEKYKIKYFDLDNDFKVPYERKLKNFILLLLMVFLSLPLNLVVVMVLQLKMTLVK